MRSSVGITPQTGTCLASIIAPLRALLQGGRSRSGHSELGGRGDGTRPSPLLGDDYPNTLTTKDNFAETLRAEGDLAATPGNSRAGARDTPTADQRRPITEFRDLGAAKAAAVVMHAIGIDLQRLGRARPRDVRSRHRVVRLRTLHVERPSQPRRPRTRSAKTGRCT